MRSPAYSGQFRRDIKLAEKRGKDLGKLRRILQVLIDNKPLAASYRDHPLKGKWAGWRDLHLEPDWLLIYKADSETVRFEPTGSRSDLFKE